jgi:hypothetical protein
MKIEALLERLEYRQDSGAADDGVRYWHSHRFGMPVSVVDSIWETAWEAKVNRGTGSTAGLRRLELAILRTRSCPSLRLSPWRDRSRHESCGIQRACRVPTSLKSRWRFSRLY